MFYCVEYVLTSFMAVSFGKKNRKVSMVLFALITFIFIFRYSELSDLNAYRFFYDYIYDSAISSGFAFEPLFFGISRFFYVIGFSFDAFVAILYLFFFIIFWKATKYYTEDIGIALLIASFYMIYPAMGGLRQGICLFLYYYATRFLVQNEKIENSQKKYSLLLPGGKRIKLEFTNDIKFLLISTVCVFIHRSALFLFVVYFFSKLKLKKYFIGAALLVSVLWPYFEMVLANFQYFNGKYQAYRIDVDGDNTVSFISFRLLEYVIIFFVLILKKNRDNYEDLSLDLIELGILVQVCLSRFVSASYRILQYTDVGLVFFAVSFFGSLKKISHKYIFVAFLVVYIFARFYRLDVISYDPNWHFAFL